MPGVAAPVAARVLLLLWGCHARGAPAALVATTCHGVDAASSRSSACQLRFACGGSLQLRLLAGLLLLLLEPCTPAGWLLTCLLLLLLAACSRSASSLQESHELPSRAQQRQLLPAPAAATATLQPATAAALSAAAAAAGGVLQPAGAATLPCQCAQGMHEALLLLCAAAAAVVVT